MGPPSFYIVLFGQSLINGIKALEGEKSDKISSDDAGEEGSTELVVESDEQDGCLIISR